MIGLTIVREKACINNVVLTETLLVFGFIYLLIIDVEKSVMVIERR